jgi:hypothetical protein
MALDARQRQRKAEKRNVKERAKRKEKAREKAPAPSAFALPAAKAGDDIPRCGLCGKTKNLTRTECCGNWICDDEHTYRLFSYAHNSCMRNHRRYTLCGTHHSEGHSGRWQDCKKCRNGIETEMYVWYGTNEYNFETLPNPPSFKPTLCSRCQRRIVLGEGGYVWSGGKYICARCYEKENGRVFD